MCGASNTTDTNVTDLNATYLLTVVIPRNRLHQPILTQSPTRCQVNNLNQYTSVDDIEYQYDQNASLTYDGTYTYEYDAENRLTKVYSGGGKYADATDTYLPFTTGGDAEWVVDTNEYYYDGDSARSGETGNSQQSWLQATVEGSGTIKFWWKVACDNGDGLTFYIDGQYKKTYCAYYGSWVQREYTVSGPGTHTLTWK